MWRDSCKSRRAKRKREKKLGLPPGSLNEGFSWFGGNDDGPNLPDPTAVAASQTSRPKVELAVKRKSQTVNSRLFSAHLKLFLAVDSNFRIVFDNYWMQKQAFDSNLSFAQDCAKSDSDILSEFHTLEILEDHNEQYDETRMETKDSVKTPTENAALKNWNVLVKRLINPAQFKTIQWDHAHCPQIMTPGGAPGLASVQSLVLSNTYLMTLEAWANMISFLACCTSLKDLRWTGVGSSDHDAILRDERYGVLDVLLNVLKKTHALTLTALNLSLDMSEKQLDNWLIAINNGDFPKLTSLDISHAVRLTAVSYQNILHVCITHRSCQCLRKTTPFNCPRGGEIKPKKTKRKVLVLRCSNESTWEPFSCARTAGLVAKICARFHAGLILKLSTTRYFRGWHTQSVIWKISILKAGQWTTERIFTLKRC